MAAAELRQHDRYSVELPVGCSSYVLVTSQAMNLSRGGLFIASEKPLPLRSLVELTLTLPGSSSEIHALGRVVWNHELCRGANFPRPGMGVEFLSMSHADWDRLIEFLADLPVPEVTPLPAGRR